MSRRGALVGFVLVATMILPAATWHPRPPLPAVPTHVIRDAHVAHCQRLAAGWDPLHSDRSLRKWGECMKLRNIQP